jgi:hypothetical protein
VGNSKEIDRLLIGEEEYEGIELPDGHYCGASTWDNPSYDEPYEPDGNCPALDWVVEWMKEYKLETDGVYWCYPVAVPARLVPTCNLDNPDDPWGKRVYDEQETDE